MISVAVEHRAAPLVALLRLPEVQRLTGLSRSTIYRLIDAGDFPRQLRIAANSVGWMQQEITDWIAERTHVHS